MENVFPVQRVLKQERPRQMKKTEGTAAEALL